MDDIDKFLLGIHQTGPIQIAFHNGVFTLYAVGVFLLTVLYTTTVFVMGDEWNHLDFEAMREVFVETDLCATAWFLLWLIFIEWVQQR